MTSVSFIKECPEKLFALVPFLLLREIKAVKSANSMLKFAFVETVTNFDLNCVD